MSKTPTFSFSGQLACLVNISGLLIFSLSYSAVRQGLWLEEDIRISSTGEMSLFIKRGGSKKAEARNRREVCKIPTLWFEEFFFLHCFQYLAIVSCLV